MKLMDIINEMKIKVLSGHLTALDKKVVKQMLDKKMKSGRVKKTDYFIKDMGAGKYEITQRKMDTGIGTCGKDGQSVPVGVGQPTMLINNLTVGGTATS